MSPLRMFAAWCVFCVVAVVAQNARAQSPGILAAPQSLGVVEQTLHSGPPIQAAPVFVALPPCTGGRCSYRVSYPVLSSRGGTFLVDVCGVSGVGAPRLRVLQPSLAGSTAYVTGPLSFQVGAASFVYVQWLVTWPTAGAQYFDLCYRASVGGPVLATTRVNRT